MTVKLNICIEISTDGEVDTGLTIEQWNALTYDERAALTNELWDEEAGSHDQGGVWVITEGAVGV